jgi:hypothetical protein
MSHSAYFRQQIIVHAKSFVGIKEKSNNSGFHNAAFEKQMKDSGFIPGYAWCCIFCEMVYRLALNDLEKNTKLSFKSLREDIQSTINPSTQSTYNNVKKSKFFKQSQRPQEGDIVIFVNSSRRAFGHAGIVIKVDGDKFTTVEGNTNTSGSAEGDGVYIKERIIEANGKGLDVRGFINIINF